MSLTVRAGERGRLLFVAVRDSEDLTQLVTGLMPEAGAELAYIRDDAQGAQRLPLTPGRPGVHSDASFVEADPARLPGVYQLGIPDPVLSEGASIAVLVLRHPRGIVDPVQINLVAYDPQDNVRLGMSALAPDARIAALHGAFPRLAAEEMRERAALQEPE